VIALKPLVILAASTHRFPVRCAAPPDAATGVLAGPTVAGVLLAPGREAEPGPPLELAAPPQPTKAMLPSATRMPRARASGPEPVRG
jgi:hypothetical protein